MSIAQKVFESSYFQILTNLIQRFLGVISTLILARVLTPSDFGMIAVLALSTNLIATLSDVGSRQYIIQKQETDDDDLNTAWTIDFLGKLGITLALWILAPSITGVLDKPELTLPLRVISLSIPLQALSNPGFILLAKELNYRNIFRLSLWQKFLSFFCVMTLVVVAPSYWVVVVGDIVSALVMLVGSYVLHKHRPIFSLKRLASQWSFSQWSLLRGLTGFARSQTDMMIVTKAFPAPALGSYHLLRELALTPVLTLIIPATDPLLAAIANAKRDNALLKYRIRICLITLISVLLPMAVYISGFSKPIVGVILGHQWIAHHALLSVFSMMFFAFALHDLLSNCFTALNKVKLLFYFDLISTAVIVSSLIFLIHLDLFNFAFARGVLGLAVTSSLLILLNWVAGFGLKKLLFNILPACISSLFAINSALFTEHLVDDVLISSSNLLALAASSIVFSAAFLLIYLPITIKAKSVFTENYEAFKMLTNNLPGFVPDFFRIR